MTVKIICDRCKTEFPEGSFEIGRKDFEGMIFHLCISCSKVFDQHLDEAKQNLKQKIKTWLNW